MASQTPTLNRVIDQLVTEQWLAPASREAIAATVAAQTERGTPWYIQGLIGLSGWVAALFFIGFLGILGVIDTEIPQLVAGLLFCAGATSLAWATRRSIFAGQLTLALSLAGQGLFIAGLHGLTDSIPATLLGVIIFEIVLLALYPDTLHRFISGLLIAGALLYLFVDLEWEELTHPVVVLLMVATVLIWHYESWFLTGPLAAFYRPVGYSLPLATFAFLVISLTDGSGIDYWWLSAVGLLVVLLYLAYQILTEQGLSWQQPLALGLFAGILLLMIPAYQTPGILAALIGLLLGFQRGNQLLLGLATAFLALFLIGYYYNLEISLLTKSYILLGTGVILLALRLGLRHLSALGGAS